MHILTRVTGSVILLAIILAVSPGYAQDEDTTFVGWKKSLIVDLTATQTAYSDSWNGGEAGSFNWVGNVNGSAERQFHLKVNFKSTLKMSFGQTHTQDKDSGKWREPVKSTDLIDWENVARFTLGGFVDPYAAFRLESQFLDASFDAKKRYFNPIKLTESGGIARVLYEKEDNQVITRLGLALRQFLSTNVTDSVALTTESMTSSDGGIESVTDVKYAFNERLNYTGKLTLFKAFFYSEKDKVKGLPEEDYWKSVDINWENIVNAKITSIVSVNFYTQVLYDKQVDLRGRFKETLGLGVVFSLI